MVKLRSTERVINGNKEFIEGAGLGGATKRVIDPVHPARAGKTGGIDDYHGL